jgi:endonuclease YncB( thermonuclease family)
MRTFALGAAVLLAGCASTSAKDDLEARLLVLESQVAAVERRADSGVTLLDRVTALEAALAVPPPGPNAEVAARLAALEAQVTDLSARVTALEASPAGPAAPARPAPIPSGRGDVAPPVDGTQVEVLSAGSGALVLVRTPGGLVRLQLRGIDAPERAEVYAQSANIRARHAEAFGEAATRDDAAFEASRRKLEELLRGASPTVQGSAGGSGGAAAYLLNGDIDLNAAMIREGFALARPGHPRAAEYEALEAQAREAKRGLFAPR